MQGVDTLESTDLTFIKEVRSSTVVIQSLRNPVLVGPRGNCGNSCSVYKSSQARDSTQRMGGGPGMRSVFKSTRICPFLSKKSSADVNPEQPLDIQTHATTISRLNPKPPSTPLRHALSHFILHGTEKRQPNHPPLLHRLHQRSRSDMTFGYNSSGSLGSST
jgi:hypothetical protein